MKKDIPTISLLLKAMIVEDYASAIDIITKKDFNPNETNKTWNSPILSAMIDIMADELKNVKDEKSLRTVMKEIAKHKDFNPNITDVEGETIMMHIARHSDFNWLAPFILMANNFDINIKNFMHRDAISLAEKCGNHALVDVLLTYKAQNIKHDGMPKKIKGLKKIKTVVPPNTNVLQKIEGAFYEEAKKRPTSLYNLLAAFFKGDYTTCIQIVRDVNFNPNEMDKWDEPVLSSLIYYSQDANVEYDEEMFKTIASIIISLPRFDVNALDCDCNTVLMVSMGYPKLKWLTEKLFNISSARLDVLNDMGEGIREIAENCGNEDFYNHLIRKSFETAKVIS